MDQTIINSNGYSIFIGNDVFETIRSYLHQYEFKENKIFVLADENSRKFCLPRLMSNIQLFQRVHIVEVPPGEESKNLDIAQKIWQELVSGGADRSSVLINLGGGVVSDLGGFAASTFKRGIRYVNIPTTLLAMVDASIGGKVGIDMDGLKNQIGIFSNPQIVFIIPEFLDTLPRRQMLNGFAEVVKHALIYEKHYWEDISVIPFRNISNWKEIINWSAEIKNYFVMEDPLDKGFRNVLNFGHTVGHALEAFSLMNDRNPLLHGEAISVGLICESYISNKQAGLPIDEMNAIVGYINSNFDYYPLSADSLDAILDNMKHDKKNDRGYVNFTLLTSIGNSMINQHADIKLVRESLLFYSHLKD
jgi:3-dehydroquinate synthase